MKISVLILLTACSVHGSPVTKYSRNSIPNYDSYVKGDMIKKAKHYASIDSSYPKIQYLKPADCFDVLKMGHNKSGIYQIWPISNPTTFRTMEGISFYVYCDMDTNGGGWTVLQRRGNFKRPRHYFNKRWENYKKGFGNMEEDFWLGNDKIFALTNQKLYSVRFDLKSINETRYAVYDEFWTENEERNYTLQINGYSGDAGNSMMFHEHEPFSTFDHDNSVKCAEQRTGGWWFLANCASAVNLNGMYYKEKSPIKIEDGIRWSGFNGDHESLKWTEIKIRPKYFRAT